MEHEHETSNRNKIIRLSIGAFLLAAGIVLERLLGGYLPLVVFIAAYLLLGGDILLYAARSIGRRSV
ncbi:MAG: hypothetical protein FWE69_07900, partial [Clostridiales bacterium]|nr:hypothetical protein [Clostridiales bacterium]